MIKHDLIGKIVQCHLDFNAPETFVVGRLVYVDKCWFLMQNISPAGRWDGLVLYLQSDIVAVDLNSEYIDKLKILLEHREENPPEVFPLVENILLSFLAYSKKNATMIGIELCKSGFRDLHGIIESFNNDVLCIRQFDEFGQYDGKSFIKLDAISRCYMDEEEKCLDVLCRHLGKG